MKKNFTLIELIVSIVVIGILAAIIMLNISDWRLQAEETARAVTEKELQTAVDRYKMKYGEYPTQPQPTKDNPQLLIPEKVVPEMIKKKFKEDYLVRVDDKGTVTVEKGNAGGEEQPTTPLTCEAAMENGYICIYTPEEFYAIRDNVKGKYILMNDIDLAGFANWQPIGTFENPFEGILNGNQQTVRNLTITDYVDGYELGVPNPYGWGIDKSHTTGLFGVIKSGEITELSIDQASLNMTIGEEDFEGDGQTNTYGGLLAGYVYSNEGNNAEQKGLSISSVSVKGSVQVVGSTFSNEPDSFAALIGKVATNSAIEIKNIQTDTDITYVNATVSGLIGDVSFESDSALHFQVEDITVSGELRGRTAVGTVGDISSTNNTGYVRVQRIQMNAHVITTEVDATGLMGEVLVTDGTMDFDIQEVTVDGTIEAETDFGSVFGLTLGLEFKPLKGELIIENIEVNGELNGSAESEVYGLFFYVQLGNWSETPEITLSIRNITISSHMQGGFVGGLGYFVETRGPVKEVAIHDISITSQVDAEGTVFGLLEYFNFSETNKFTTSDIQIDLQVNEGGQTDGENIVVYGFVQWLYVEEFADAQLQTFTIRNIAINLNAAIKGNIYGFADEIFYKNDTGDTENEYFLIENVKITGSLEAKYGSIFGFAALMESYHEGQPAPMKLRNISTDASLKTTTGDIYSFTDQESFGTYFYVGDDDLGTYKPYSPETDSHLILEAISAAGHVSTISGNIYTSNP